jgi:hypothetical protein
MGLFFDQTKWKDQKEKLRAQMKTEIGKIKEEVKIAVKEVAHEIAAELANETFPTAEKRNLARGSIRGKVYSVFTTGAKIYLALETERGKAVAGAFWAAYQHGDYSRMRTLLQGTSYAYIEFGSPDEGLYESNKRQRLGRAIRLCAKDQLQRFAQKLEDELIGKAASGWAACAADLGSETGIPHWKSTAQHGTDQGHAIINDTGERYQIILVNVSDYVRTGLEDQDVQRALEKGRSRLRQKLGQ